MSKQFFSTPKAANLQNSQNRSGQLSSKNPQSNKTPMNQLNNLTEVTIETFDKEVPYISLFKPDPRRQLLKTQALIVMNKVIAQKRFTLFRSFFMSLKGIKLFENKVAQIVTKVHRVVSHIERFAQKNAFFLLISFKKYKNNGILATKLIKNLYNRKYHQFLVDSLGKIQTKRLIWELQLSKNENKLVAQLNIQKTEIFKLKQGLFSIEFIMKVKPLQKYIDKNSYLTDLQNNNFQDDLKSQINRFQQLRAKGIPKRKQPLDNEIVLNMTGCLHKALLSCTKEYEQQIDQLNGQLESYKNVDGINQLRESLSEKQSQILKIEGFVNQITKLDGQLKRFSNDSAQINKISSLIKTHNTKLEPRAKKFEGIVLKIHVSRTFLYELIMFILQFLKKISDEPAIIQKKIISQYKQPQNLIKYLKQSHNKTNYQQIGLLLINQFKTISDYQSNNEAYNQENQELKKKINQSNAEVVQLKKQITKIQARSKDLQSQNQKLKQDLQAKIKQIKVLKPFEKQINKITAQNNRLKAERERMTAQHEQICISFKEQIFTLNNQKFTLDQKIKVFQEERSKVSQEMIWLRNKLSLAAYTKGNSLIQETDNVGEQNEENNLHPGAQSSQKDTYKELIKYFQEEKTKFQEKIQSYRQKLSKAEEKIRILENDDSEILILQQKIKLLESQKQMLEYKCKILLADQEKSLKLQQRIKYLQNEKDQRMKAEERIRILVSQTQVLKYKCTILQSDRERLLIAEEKIKIFQNQKSIKEKLQQRTKHFQNEKDQRAKAEERIRILVSETQILKYKCIILQSDRERLLIAQEKILKYQSQSQIKVQLQQRIRNLQKEKQILEFKLYLMINQNPKIEQSRQQANRYDKGYQLLEEKIRILLEQKSEIENKCRILQNSQKKSQIFDENAKVLQSQRERNERGQQNLRMLWSQRIKELSQQSHHLQIQLQSKIKIISQFTQQNVKKQKRIQELYSKHLEAIDQLSALKINYEKDTISLYKDIEAFQSESKSYKITITKIQQQTIKKQQHIQTLTTKIRSFQEISTKQKYLIENLTQKLRLSQQKYMQQKNKKVNEYLLQTQNLKRQYEYIVKQYKLKMQKLQPVERQRINVEKRLQEKLKEYNELKLQFQHLKIKNLGLKTENEGLHHEKKEQLRFVGELQSKITEFDDLTIHLKSQITQINAQYFKASLELQNHQTTRIYTDNRQFSIKRQLKDKEFAIETILQQSKQQNNQLLKQLYQTKEQMQRNRRQYELQLNEKHNFILKMQLRLTSKESTIKSLQNLISLSEHLTQNTNQQPQLQCKNQEIQLLNRQIVSLQHFLNEITAQYHSLEEKYHQERYQNKNLIFDFQATAHKSQLSVMEGLKPFYTDRDHRIIKESFSVAGSQGHSREGLGENLRLNIGEKFSEILQPVSKMNLSADAQEWLKKILVNNETLGDCMGQLRDENMQLQQKMRNMYLWIIELIFNILITNLNLQRQDKRALEIWSDLNNIRMLNNEEFFINLEKYSNCTMIR